MAIEKQSGNKGEGKIEGPWPSQGWLHAGVDRAPEVVMDDG